jgi:hypothetical protein
VIDAQKFARDVLVLKNLKGPGPHGGQDDLILSAIQAK